MYLLSIFSRKSVQWLPYITAQAPACGGSQVSVWSLSRQGCMGGSWAAGFRDVVRSRASGLRVLGFSHLGHSFPFLLSIAKRFRSAPSVERV